MNNYRARVAFRLDPATEAVLEQLSRHAFLSKASSVGHHVQEGVVRNPKNELLEQTETRFRFGWRTSYMSCFP